MADSTQFVWRPQPATLHEAADALERGEVSAETLCEQLLARHREVDGTIHAFLHLDADKVMNEAVAADQRRAEKKARSRFDGLSVAVKDNFAVVGEPCTCASRILEKYTATYDATVVERLRTQGIGCFGRTNMDEFAMGSTTESSAYGPTRNPAAPEHVPGGSSGGSAAAVASGQAMAALGSDTGGSIRQPAGFCGIVGLKPTYGRISRYGLVAYASSLDQIGVLTADVRDAALLLDMIGGQDPADCTSLPVPCGGFEASLDSFEVKGLTIGVPREFLDVDGLAPEVRAAVESARTAFEQAGARCVEVSLPRIPAAVACYYVIATAEASSNLARFDGIRYGNRVATDELLDLYTQTRAQGFGQEVKRRIILGTYVLSSGYYDAYYLRAQKVRTLIRNDFSAAFKTCDLLLGPVAPTPALPLGAKSTPLEMYLSDIYTIPVNLAGICAVSVPRTVTAAGLPVGIQLFADTLQEQRLLQSANWLLEKC